MVRAFSTQVRGGASRVGRTRIRDWEVWSLPSRSRAIVLSVVGADMLLVAAYAVAFRPHAGDALLFALLTGCSAATVELTRRASEPAGVIKDVCFIWELPAITLLPPLYALLMPAVRLALTQWRVRKAPVYRRVFTVAALGLAYGCAAAAYRAVLPAGQQPRGHLPGDAAIWLLAAVACAVTQWVVNQALVLTAIKTAEPDRPVRSAMLGRDAMHNDATELCTAALVTVGVMLSWWTLIIALPLTTMLQRSFRHDQLLRQARADAKTGLLNAATWEQLAGAEIGRAVRTSSSLAVAILDLDKFKNVNDTYGHLLGDEVLKGVARILGEELRDYDLAGRFGGEEFVVLLPQTRAVDALRTAERLRACVSRLEIYADGPSGPERIPVTVSIGVAALDAGTRRELPDLLAAADAALYRAKDSGRDQVQMISTSRGLSAVRPPANGDEDDAGAAREADQAAAVGLEEAEERSMTATTSALPVWHSEALPVRSTSGVG